MKPVAAICRGRLRSSLRKRNINVWQKSRRHTARCTMILFGLVMALVTIAQLQVLELPAADGVHERPARFQWRKRRCRMNVS